MTASSYSDIPVLVLTTLQEGAEVPALAGDAPAATATAADGAQGGANGAAQPQPPSLMFMLLPILIFFVFITFMSSRREKKRRLQLQQVVKHDRIRTRGGIIGSVVEANDDQLVIKVDESRDTRITLDRQYIDAILEGAGSGN
ncbi:MAG: preprotein translocase subunit YajC [Phycisphaerales bacterium]|nr:preprotein translocase subunit YajC [Phycisphaerales bacterium]